MNNKPHVIAYVNGSVIGQPSALAGVGVVLCTADYKTVKEFSKKLSGSDDSPQVMGGSASKPKFTNNQAELIATTFALKQLKKPCRVTIISDSEITVKCATGEYHKNANLPLWFDLEAAINEGGHEVAFQWVKGHDGNRYKERSHRLAEQAAKS